MGEKSDFPCDGCGHSGTETVLHSASGIRLCTDRDACQARAHPKDPALAQLEAENEQLALALAHVSGAITGHLKPHVAYPSKPLPWVEEGLALYRAAQLMASKIVTLTKGREPTEAEIQAEIMWHIKLAEKELPVPMPQRKETT